MPLGLIAPASLLAVSRPFLNPAGLYAAAGLRLVLGTALFVSAPASRAPTALRVLGVIVIVGGIATPLIGVKLRPRDCRVVDGAGGGLHARLGGYRARVRCVPGLRRSSSDSALGALIGALSPT